MKGRTVKAMALLMAGLYAGGLAAADNSETFAGLEQMEGTVDDIPGDNKTMIIGDRSFAVSPLMTVRYANGSVAALSTLRLGQRVRVYVTRATLDAYQPPLEAVGIEILTNGEQP